MSPSDNFRVTVDHLINLLKNTNPAEFLEADIAYYHRFLEQQIQEVVPHFPPTAVAKVISSIQINDPHGIVDRFGENRPRAHRENALAVAKSLGPDQAQDLYRFTILVTKLA